MANMFASHPQVSIPLYETETFLTEPGVLDRWRRLSADAASSGKPHFVEKTPRHLRVMDRIRSVVSGARFIVMVRDGRDVAASFLKRSGNAMTGAVRWLEDNRIVRTQAEADDELVIRYEDLVTKTQQTLRVACDFAEIGFHPGMLRFHEEKRLWFGVSDLTKGTGQEGLQHRLLRNWQINQPLYDDRGKWRLQLGQDELAIFETGEAREMLRAFGYE